MMGISLKMYLLWNMAMDTVSMFDFRGVYLAIERPLEFCQMGLQLRPLDDEPGKFSCDIVSNRMMYQQPVPQPLTLMSHPSVQTKQTQLQCLVGGFDHPS